MAQTCHYAGSGSLLHVAFLQGPFEHLNGLLEPELPSYDQLDASSLSEPWTGCKRKIFSPLDTRLTVVKIVAVPPSLHTCRGILLDDLSASEI